jgi:hypothetical protein
LKILIYFGAVAASAAAGVGSAWLVDVLASLERKWVRVLAKAGAASSALVILIGAAMVGFQHMTWPGGWGVLWGVGQVVLLLAALATCFGGFCALIAG